MYKQWLPDLVKWFWFLPFTSNIFHVSTFTNTFQVLFVQAVCLISFHWAVIYLHTDRPAGQDHKARTHKHMHTQTHTHTKLCRKTNCAEWDFLSRRQWKLLFLRFVGPPFNGEILASWGSGKLISIWWQARVVSLLHPLNTTKHCHVHRSTHLYRTKPLPPT